MNLVLAYLDPGSGSLILQALVGGLSGLVVLGRYLWTQFLGRKPMQTALPISSGEIPISRH